MKASVENIIKSSEIPIAYLRGRKTLYSQDFVNIENLLAYDDRFLSDVVGTFITTPGSDIRLKVSNVDITDEFYEDPETSDVIPLWYSQVLTRPVTSNVVKKRTINVTVNPVNVENGIAQIEDLIEQERQTIDTKSIIFSINAQVQSSNSYLIDHGRGIFFADISDLDAGDFLLSITYDLVEVAVEVNNSSGVAAIRTMKHDNGEYVVRILYSMATSGKVIYQTGGKTVEESIVPVLLYHQVAPDIVSTDAHIYALTDRIVFPSNRNYHVFAVRPRNVESPTVLTPTAPQGLPIDTPWFIRLEGQGIDEIPIREIPESRTTKESRRELVKVLNRKQLSISGRQVQTEILEDGTIGGLLVYASGFRDRPLKIEAYNSTHGIITLSVPVPLEATLFAEYVEEVDWIDYTDIQINPSLSEDPSLLQDNFILLYIDNDKDPIRSIHHIMLPRFTDTEIKEYTIEEIGNILTENGCQNAIPFALISIVEPADKDYYEVHDVRTRGGYTGNYRYVTDSSLWDGEDVDISGVMIAKVPRYVIDNLIDNVTEWENVTGDTEEFAKDRIETVMEKYKRIGMNIIAIDYEEPVFVEEEFGE